MTHKSIQEIKNQIKELEEELRIREANFYPEKSSCGGVFNVTMTEAILAGTKPFECIIQAFGWHSTLEGGAYWDKAYKKYRNTKIEDIPWEYTYKLMTWVINYYRINGGKPSGHTSAGGPDTPPEMLEKLAKCRC